MKIRALMLMIVVAFAMPSWAQETPSKLEKKTLFGGNIEIMAPSNFELLDSSVIDYKYPSANKPKVVFSNVEMSINLAFSVKENASKSKINISLFTDIMATTLKDALPGSKVLDQGVVRQNGGDFGYVEIRTKALDTQIYNLMYFVITEEELIIVSFNCPMKLLKEWKPVAKDIMASLVVKGA